MLIAFALIVAACGNGDDTGIPGPTAAPVGVVATATANQPVGATPTASPTSPAPVPATPSVTTTARPTSSEVAAAPSAVPSPDVEIIHSGTYSVPDEIGYGVYRVGGYWARLDSALKVIDDDGVYGNGIGLMVVQQGDSHIEINGEAVPLGDYPARSVLALMFSKGTYLVGVDIEPGRYRVIDPEHAFAARLDDELGVIDSVSNASSVSIEIHPTDFAFAFSGAIAPLPYGPGDDSTMLDVLTSLTIEPEYKGSGFERADFEHDRGDLCDNYGIDPYTGIEFDPATCEVDHIAAPQEAFESGAWQWDAVRRQEFGNDALNLVATRDCVHQSKGARDMAEWLGQFDGGFCDGSVTSVRGRCYLAWKTIEVKAAYSLSVDLDERNSLSRVLDDCPGSGPMQSTETSGSQPAPEPTVYEYPTGLVCYEVGLRSWEDPPSRVEAAGFPTLEEAATNWWHNSPEAQMWHQRDGTPSISAEDLTQSPPSSLPPPRGSAASGINPETAPKSPPVYIYFRDDRQHAQIVIAGHQRDDGNWIISSSQHCAYDD